MYIYDENGNKTEMYTFTAEKGEVDHIIWEYDERGNTIRKISPYHDDDGNIVSYINEWEYDERGNAIRETSYDGYDNVESTALIYYDDRDLPIRREEYYVRDGKRRDTDVIYYSYDEEGNLTKTDGENDGTEYDRLGNLTKSYLLSIFFKRLDEQRVYQYHYSPE